MLSVAEPWHRRWRPIPSSETALVPRTFCRYARAMIALSRSVSVPDGTTLPINHLAPMTTDTSKFIPPIG